jgi:hypothetical protein
MGHDWIPPHFFSTLHKKNRKQDNELYILKTGMSQRTLVLQQTQTKQNLSIVIVTMLGMLYLDSFGMHTNHIFGNGTEFCSQ